MRRALFTVSLVPVVLAAGCNIIGGGTAGTGGQIQGVRWVLTSIDVKGTATPVPQGVTIDATFTDGRVVGFGGCNSYNGPYQIDGAKITVGPLASTQKACVGPAGELEAGYLGSLSAAASYTATAETLTIYDIPGTALLVYAPGPANPLAGSWTVTGYNDGVSAVVSPIAGTELTATFGEDGTLAGSSGCNQYSGTYALTGETLAIGPLATTKMACPEDIMTQETRFLAALAGSTGYRLSGDTLTLLLADGSNGVTLIPAR
jgi:heat shock protein HslJ